MNFEFLNTMSTAPKWEILKNQLLSNQLENYYNSFQSLSSSDLVYVMVDINNKPVLMKSDSLEPEAGMIFTKPNLVGRIEKLHSCRIVLTPALSKGEDDGT